MKKFFSKLNSLMALILTILVLFSTVSSTIVFSIAANSQNILSDKLPIAFYTSDSDSYEVNGGKIKYGQTSISQMEAGYDESNIATQEFWDEYTEKFTDGDTDSGTLLMPENSSKKDRVILIYKFSEHIIDKLEISFGLNKRRYFSVYLSKSRSNLFSSEAIFTVDGERTYDFSVDISNISATYIGIVFENPNFNLLDIKLYGTKKETEITGENLLKSLTPYTYASANSGEFTYNWNMTHYGPDVSEKKHGYADPSASNKAAFWDDYTKALTDENTDNGLYIQNENIGNCKRVIAVYELNNYYDISGFKINAENKSKSFSVYMSSSYSSLFSGVASSIYNDETNTLIAEGLTDKKVKYIGFVFEIPAYTVYEISVYGQLYEAPDVENSLIKDKLPTMYASANSGAFEWNWHQQYYGMTSAEKYFGYNEASSSPNNWGEKNPDGWGLYTKAVTDGDLTTSMYVKPEFSTDRLIIVYQLGEYKMTGFLLEMSKADKNISVYASGSRSGLFEGEPVFMASNSKESTYEIGDLEARASYVGIIIESTACDIFEFAVFGEEYVRPNYGTDLTDGKEIVAAYVAERSYPIVGNGYEFVNMVATENSIPKINDNDFVTAASFTPWYAGSTPVPTDPYIVFVIDLEYISQIDKILIDSKLGGIDIFIADDYLDLFGSMDNRVYSSEGDTLIADGSAFDSSYDMPSGENIIDIGGISGRFVGLVVTRSAKTGTANWGAATINELQIFGTAENVDYGDNILYGKTPIMSYRAAHGEYETSLGDFKPNLDAATMTDGEFVNNVYQFPHSSGYVNYKFGGLVLIYYLEGTVDINRLSFKGNSYYYCIGGLSVYTAEKFADLLKEESCIFDSKGYQNNEGVYDIATDINCARTNIYPDDGTKGRYVAFVVTRPYSVKTAAWGSIRISEIEVYGEVMAEENLPDTVIHDPDTGATASFIFANPDEKFDFADLGVKTFGFEEVTSALTDNVYHALNKGNYKNMSAPFRMAFYDKNGKEINKSILEGLKVELTIPQKSNTYYYLGEIYDDMVYSFKAAEHIGDNLVIAKLEDLNKIFIYLTQGKPTKIPVIAFSENNSDDDSTDNSYIPLPDTSVIAPDTENTITDNTEQQNKPSGGRKWVEVKIDDPLEWFWNIYDTFAANIWMLIMCILVLLLGIAAVIFSFIYTKKKRSKAQ